MPIKADLTSLNLNSGTWPSISGIKVAVFFGGGGAGANQRTRVQDLTCVKERRSIVSQGDVILSEISIISLRVAKVWVTLTHTAACVATF